MASSRTDTKTKPFILIGDTSPYILEHLAGIFELANFEVRTATSAQQCLEIFEETKDKVDIVLLDGAIAGDAGVHVILSIRRQKPHEKILVVAEEENVRVKAMKVGADVVVMKPITAEAILAKVNDMLIEKNSFMHRKKAKYTRKS